MALPDEAVLQVGDQFSFADHAGDFAAAAANNFENGAQTDVQISLVGVADTEARESVKVDLGASRNIEFAVYAALEFAATPAAASYVEFYWAPSPSATPANANPGGVTGADADYTGIDSDLANSVKNLQFIGLMTTTNDPTTVVQEAYIGTFSPRERYGTLVVKNESGAALHSDDVECHVVLNGIAMKTID